MLKRHRKTFEVQERQVTRKERINDSHIPGKCLAIKVLGREKEDIDFALKLFKKKVKDSKIIDEYKECQHYKKPSEIRRVQKNYAILLRKRSQISID